MPIKTRINTKTKASKAAQKIGGFTFAELVKARQGDTAILKRLQKVHREGKIAELAMPLIKEAISSKVQNEKDWNQFVSQYIKDGSQAELLIQSAQFDASFANGKYVHGMKELTEKSKAAWEVESDRHKFAIDYNRAKLFADLLIQDVESNARLFEQGARVKTKQLQSDLEYEEKEIKTISEYGSQGLDLIQKRDYTRNEKGLRGVVSRIKNSLGL
jgi:hypothetical protein